MAAAVPVLPVVRRSVGVGAAVGVGEAAGASGAAMVERFVAAVVWGLEPEDAPVTLYEVVAATTPGLLARRLLAVTV